MFKIIREFFQDLRFYQRKLCCKYRHRSEAVILRKNPQNKKIEVLLVERIRRHKPMHEWKFPGGGIERGETSEVACARESVEEAGIKGKPCNFLLSYTDVERRTRTEIFLITEYEEMPFDTYLDGNVRKRQWFPMDVWSESIFKSSRKDEMQQALKKALDFLK